MYDVLLVAHAVVAAYGAGEGGASVGGAGHLAHDLHRVYAFPAAQHHRSRHHRGFYGGVERLADEVGIVLGAFFLREAVHLERGEFQALLFEPGDDFPAESALECAGLQYH